MMFMFGMRIGQYVSAPVTYWTGPWLHFSHICLFYFHCTMAFLCCFDQAIFFCHASYYSCRPLIQSMEMFRVFFFFFECHFSINLHPFPKLTIHHDHHFGNSHFHAPTHFRGFKVDQMLSVDKTWWVLKLCDQSKGLQILDECQECG